MAKWMNALLEEIDKNKSHPIPLVSILTNTSEKADVKINGPTNMVQDATATETNNVEFVGGKLWLTEIHPSYADAIETIINRNKPRQILQRRWTVIIQRLKILINDERDHLLKMAGYNWPLEELFGCHRVAPDARIDGMGLLMLIAHSTIAEVHPAKAFIRSKGGSMMSYRLGAINRSSSECSTLMEIE